MAHPFSRDPHCGPRRGAATGGVPRLVPLLPVLLTLGIVTVGFAAADAPRASAAQTNVAISTAAPPAAPRILGPGTFAARAASPLLYTIPATGQKPLIFQVTGLPSGLTVGAASGTISGNMPAAGSYPVSVTVSNTAGTAQQILTLLASDTLSPTPPMGWNSYDSFGGGVRESEVLQAAEAQRAQLQPFGWHYVVVDYLWFDTEQVTGTEQVIDANGRYLPSPSRFPSATGSLGFKPLADKVHALGLGFGIHIMRGIPRKSVSANAPIAGSTYTASNAGNTSDACPWDAHMWGVRGDTAAGQAWYDSIFAQYAQWGVDFVKVDDLLNNQVTPNLYHQAEVDAIRKAIDKTGRSIVLSLSPGPMRTADATNLNSNANMWRMVNDFWDKNGLSTLADVFDASAAWQAVSDLRVGHWPDADMLPLGYLGPRCPVHASGATALTQNQQVTVMSLWTILPSPLMFGGNVPALTTDATGPFTLALLTNEEILAVNQDALGARGKRITQQGTTEVWAKEMTGGRKAVALFNRGTQDAPVSVTYAQLAVTGTPVVRDLWHRRDVAATTAGSLSATVPYEAALMFLLSPSQGGAGGAGGSGGGGAGGGGSNSGGVGAGGGTTGGSPGVDGGTVAPDSGAGGASVGGGARAGTVGSTGGGGGASSTSGGSGPGSAGTGGSAPSATGGATASSTGGARAASGGSAPGGAPPAAASGCGCAMAAGERSSRNGWWWLAMAALTATVLHRRRR